VLSVLDAMGFQLKVTQRRGHRARLAAKPGRERRGVANTKRLANSAIRRFTPAGCSMNLFKARWPLRETVLARGLLPEITGKLQ
jgi:hypothetical protein